ncbi:Zinc finger protein ZPR1 [Camelus dromedarius]|uniref:Zinc finger protein ZPR1 n=1 Tax=Camelus dromedarius TaxID=9838 RepID=A0A5N4C7A4_CAMDR|nr:Zinc finger protein ZPR1 [Camelus dromedarius]
MSASGLWSPGPRGLPPPRPQRPGLRPGHLFRPFSAEDEEQQPTEIESLCMNCYRNRNNRELPFLRGTVCWNNHEIQSAGRIQDQGCALHLTVRAQEDMNREVVKTDSATTRIPELDFEIPAFSQKRMVIRSE